MVYTAQSQSLATLEVLVHVPAAQLKLPYVAVWADLPEGLVEQMDPALLPKDWTTYPAPQELRRLGDDWIQRASSAVLAVPSAIISSETNYLLNPAHPEFSRVELGKELIPYGFDRRLR